MLEKTYKNGEVMKIAIIGTHGVGKTTLSAEMYAHASMTGRNVKLITEIARQCPLALNENFTYRAAEWIVMKHLILEIEAEAKQTKFIVCDRSVFDPIVYAMKQVEKTGVETDFFRDDPLYRLARQSMTDYDVILNIRPSSNKIFSDGIRATDPHFQRDIYNIFERELDFMGLRFIDYKHCDFHQKFPYYLDMYAEDIFDLDNEDFFEDIFKK